MKFVITGIGSIGRRHFQNLYKLGFHNVAVVRRSPRADKPQKEFLAKFKPKVFYDLDEALRTKPDVVFVTNPTSLHAATALKAVRSEAHVFVEKPIAHNRSGVSKIIAEAKKRNRVLYVGYHFRFHPQLKVMKKYIASGALGKISSARFVTGEYLPGWHPWENYRRSYSARKDLGGGVVLTQSHDLDAAFWFFGRPKAVIARVANTGTFKIDVDDIADMIFSLERCPAVYLHLDYLERPPVKRYTVTGSKGRLEWDYHRGALHLIKPNGKVREFKLPKGFRRNDMYLSEIRDFLSCIRNQRETGEDAAKVLEMALRAKEASRLKKALNF